MSMEKRILIAFVLSAIIFAIWSVIFPPPKPVRSKAVETIATPSATVALGENTVKDLDVANDTVEASLIEATSSSEARIVELANDVMRLALNTEGAAIEELYLTEFDNAQGEPLNLVQSVVHPKRTLPLQMVFDGTPDLRVYEVTEGDDSLIFAWADGAGRSVVKTISLNPEGYGLRISVQILGFDRESALSLGTGMRDTSAVERANRFATWGYVTIATGDDKEDYRREKVKERLALAPTGLRYVGFEDTYFLSVFRVEDGVSRIVVEPIILAEINEKGEDVELPVLRVDLESVGGVFTGELFAAPKEYLETVSSPSVTTTIAFRPRIPEN